MIFICGIGHSESRRCKAKFDRFSELLYHIRQHQQTKERRLALEEMSLAAKKLEENPRIFT